MQLMTGSAGASYRWNGNLFTTDMTYGGGRRSGFANVDHTPPYVVVNAGVSREFQRSSDGKPVTLRFDVVNLFDQILRASQRYWHRGLCSAIPARRGFYAGISQKLG